MRQRYLIGAGSDSGKGGGGASGRTAQEAPDSLRSKAYARVLDLISEGEIEGLVNGLQSVYLDGTPLQNADGSFNFSGVSAAIVTGTQNQDMFNGVPATESVNSVGVEVLQATPVVRTVTNADVDAVRVTLSFPGLTRQDTTNGDLNGTSVQIAIAVQSNGGGYVSQSIGYDWSQSVNPAVLASIGLSLDATWSAALAVDASGNMAYGSITYQVQYRAVGAPGWTTFKEDSLTTADLQYSYDDNGYTVTTFPTRTYDMLDLVEDEYEARLYKTSGDGSVTISGFRILSQVPYDTIAGKTVSTYQRSYRVPLTGSAPWDIRVSRITADSVSAALNNKTVWAAYTEIIDEKFNYPNSAIVAMSVDASQFKTIPTRAYDVKLLRVQIPSNYNPVTRTYTGVWDGTFTVAWTDNPAWCFYDLLTNARYGLGEFIAASQVDKWALYAIGVYCDEMVPNGYGVNEPRFTCNLYLQTQAEAFQVITSLASVFRGMAYWAAGSITAVQDSPADPVFLFTEANVENGLFTYSGSAKNARHTVALVNWNDPDDGYTLKPEYVEDLDGIARYGVVETTVTAFACTSRGQAHRVGKWLLYSERMETESIGFVCGTDGIYLRPGDIFAVQDQHRAGIRYGGRIRSATSTSITIDRAITINSGETYTVKVVLPDGTLDTRTVTNAPGSATVLTVSVAFTATPVSPAVWMVTSNVLAPRLYRALSIVEVERHKYEVQGVEHSATKYDAIEQGLTLRVPKTSTVGLVPDAPENVTISESLAIRQGLVKAIVTIEWEPVETATRYRVEYRRDTGNYAALPEVSGPSAEIVDAIPGYYDVRVVAVNVLQASSLPATAARQIYGKTAPPEDVTGFVVSRTGDTLNFSWVAVGDLDLSHYELRQGTTWAAGVPLGITINTQYQVTTNIGTTYLIKAIDTSGNESVNASAIIIGANTDINVVVTQNDSPTWSGVKSQTRVTPSGVTLDGQNTWSDLTGTWASYTGSWLAVSNLYGTGTYETVPVDLGAVMTSRVEIHPTVQQVPISGVWNDLTGTWASYTAPWSGDPGQIEVTYEMAISQDGVTYAAWQTFLAGTYEGWAFKFRVTLTALDVANYLPLLTSLLVTVDVPDRVLHFEDQATSPSGTTLTFSPAFINVQTVTGTIQGGSVGDTFRVTGKSTTGATITVYDSAGVAKAGNVDIDVFGYGAIA